jgi:hypothetical protein
VARLLTAGAETLDAIGDNATMEGGITNTGTVTVDTATVNTGLKSFKFDSGGGSTASVTKTISPVLGTIFYARMWFRLPQAGGDIPSLRITLDSGNGLSASVYISSANRSLSLRDNVGTIGSSTAALSQNTWYCVELAAQNNSVASTSYREARLNGVSFASSSTRNATTVGTGLVEFGWIGNPGASNIIYLDDLAVNDSGGANENSWPGCGKQVLLLPISDNAVGTGWTNDNLVNNTVNLFESVDNIPPIGIADTTTSTTSDQIRNATNATANYDANLTTYATAGIGAADTVNLVQPWIITGAPTATGAKTGALQITSNPAEGAATAFQTTSNFFRASGVNAGTYPTGWAFSTNPITYAPSVTVGSSPVLRADITGGTATRIAMCCFMGLYVDYTPAAVAGQIPYTNQMPQLIAQ